MASPLQPVRPPAKHAAPFSCGLRGKVGSPPPAPAKAAVTPLGKSPQQTAQRSVSHTATHTIKQSATRATKADDGPHAAETGLLDHNDKSAISTPVQLAASSGSRLAGGHDNAVLLADTISVQEVPVQGQQAKKPSNQNTTPVLPVPKATVAAMDNAVPETKAAADIAPAPSSMKEAVRQDADSLVMVRRLPAVLTGSLPTLESLGIQVSLPSGADMLSKAPFCCIQSAYCWQLALTGPNQDAAILHAYRFVYFQLLTVLLCSCSAS